MTLIFIQITLESEFFPDVYSLYESSFPENERRTLAQLETCFKNSNYRMEAYFVSDIFVGFVEYWIFNSFIYVEHIAVRPDYQRKSIGKQMMKNIISLNAPIFLEIELLIDEITKQRYEFYKNLNFEIINIPYYQPSYGKGKKSIELHLLACNYDLKNEINGVIKTIYTNVYQDLI